MLRLGRDRVAGAARARVATAGGCRRPACWCAGAGAASSLADCHSAADHRHRALRVAPALSVAPDGARQRLVFEVYVREGTGRGRHARLAAGPRISSSSAPAAALGTDGRLARHHARPRRGRRGAPGPRWPDWPPSGAPRPRDSPGMRERSAALVVRGPGAGVVVTRRPEELAGRMGAPGDTAPRARRPPDALEARIALHGRRGAARAGPGQPVRLDRPRRSRLSAGRAPSRASAASAAARRGRRGAGSPARAPERLRPGMTGEASVTVRRSTPGGRALVGDPAPGPDRPAALRPLRHCALRAGAPTGRRPLDNTSTGTEAIPAGIMLRAGPARPSKVSTRSSARSARAATPASTWRGRRAGAQVALKILHPELLVSVAADRFLREIKLASQLDHPHIAHLLDSGERDWLVYYVMTYVEGPTLREHLGPGGRLSVGRNHPRWRTTCSTRWTTPTATASSTAT